jgi:Tol biopolymer transport system component
MTMESPQKLLSTFDKILLGGIGCGLVVICVLIGVFGYLWLHPPSPVPAPTAVQAPVLPTSAPAPTLPGLELATATFLPTPAGSLVSTSVPSPIPSFGGGPAPSGKIVFTCFIEQIDQICLMNADGSGRTQLTDFEATTFYGSLSPDGETVYFSSRQSGNFEIYSIAVDGGRAHRLTNGIGGLYAPELSPNGEKIVFTNGNQGIWIMDANGDDPHALTDRGDVDPTWSPDGSMIAFASARTGDRQLFIMNADGSNVRQVTNLDHMGGRSTWSPDGTRLAFYAGPFEGHEIYAVNADGTGLVQLTHGGDNLGPSWSPDGNWIAFTSFRDGNNEIYVMHPDGTEQTRVTNTAISDWQPRWGR